MLNPGVVQFKPYRTASVDDVIGELTKVIAGANPRFRFQCPGADIDALLAGVLPDESVYSLTIPAKNRVYNPTSTS